MDGTGAGREAWSVEALVHAAGAVTRYHRAGRGRAVMLLEPCGDGRGASPLFAGLARACRVFWPSLTDLSADGTLGPRELGLRLAAVADGLGLEDVGLVLAPDVAGLLGALLDGCPERFTGTVVVHRPGSAAAGAWPDPRPLASVLRVSLDGPGPPWDDPAFVRACAFLCEGGRTPSGLAPPSR